MAFEAWSSARMKMIFGLEAIVNSFQLFKIHDTDGDFNVCRRVARAWDPPPPSTERVWRSGGDISSLRHLRSSAPEVGRESVGQLPYQVEHARTSYMSCSLGSTVFFLITE